MPLPGRMISFVTPFLTCRMDRRLWDWVTWKLSRVTQCGQGKPYSLLQALPRRVILRPPPQPPPAGRSGDYRPSADVQSLVRCLRDEAKQGRLSQPAIASVCSWNGVPCLRGPGISRTFPNDSCNLPTSRSFTGSSQRRELFKIKLDLDRRRARSRAGYDAIRQPPFAQVLFGAQGDSFALLQQPGRKLARVQGTRYHPFLCHATADLDAWLFPGAPDW